jgi:hypothetical protein
MDEFHGNMLCVRSVGSASKRKKSASAEKPLGHFPASFRQLIGFDGEKGLEHLIAREQSLFNLCRQLKSRRHFAF